MASSRCGRCLKPRPAITVERIVVGGITTDLPLCSWHLDMFLTDMSAWTNCGTEYRTRPRIQVEAPAPTGPAPLVYDGRRIPPARTPTPRQRLVAAPNPALQAVLPAGWEEWEVSDRARERCRERGVAPIEALMAALHPDVTTPSDAPGVLWCRKGDVRVCIKPEQKLIITVAPRVVDDTEGRPAHVAS